jgi:endonuclease/exonuclease/phosphatase (EEP) superfamily protein YafD
MIGAIIAWILTIFFTLITFLPLVKSDYWIFRALEYPRLQKLVIGLICLLTVFFLRSSVESAFPFLFAALLGCCIYLSVKIFPYTALAQKEMEVSKNRSQDSDLKVFTANVLQTNREYGKLLQQIRQTDPDLVFLVETDTVWAEAVKELDDKYPFTIKKPLDNTYGLLFFSRLPLKNSKLLFRTDNEVPSIETEVQLPSGQWIRVFGLHPKPPVFNESLYSTAKDKELMKVAFEVEKESKPCIVMGDLNDVAWSYVTELFRKVSGLLDPRRGRGFYSTFSADNWLIRFPLDYIFCSLHFGLITMKRMPHNGSDHFAMFIHLQFDPSLLKVHEEPETDKEEREDAVEKASADVPAE